MHYMKRVGIITLNGNFNFGNKLQNYALKKYIEKNFELNVETLWTEDYKKEQVAKRLLKSILRVPSLLKRKKFEEFNRYLNVKNLEYKDIYDCYVIGSDQVWNVRDKVFNYRKYFALFANKEKNISYAASLGISKMPESEKNNFKQALRNISKISVREEAGKKIIEELMPNKNVEVLIDPTMLLSKDEWDEVAIEPKNKPKKRYILNYFLGELSEKRKKAIEQVAKENDCEIINILDKNDSQYISGPSEFLWLEKNAFLVCTDSFHSSVFALIYNRPFVVFDREDKNENMGSRIDTLISKFKLKNRRYNEKNITKENLKQDYSEAYKILKNEQNKSKIFLKNAFCNLEKNDKYE